MWKETSRHGLCSPRRDRSRSTWRRAVPLLAALLTVTLVACGDSGDDGGGATTGDQQAQFDRLVYADFGGTTRAARQGAYFGPFARETGATVVTADADPAKLVLFAENGRAEWDLVDIDSYDVVRFADRGLLARLPDDVPRSTVVPERYRDYATGGYFGSVVLSFNPENVRPQSWADFFDTKKFPGKRALPAFPNMEILAALLGDGVTCDKLFPVDLDRAFAKLDEIRDDVLVYDSYGQGQQFLLQGSAVMAALPSGRVQPIKDQGLPVDYLWKDQVLVWSAAVVPRDAPHKDAAFAFLKLQDEPEHQAEFARLTKYGPMNPDALELIDEETKAKLASTPVNAKQGCLVDPIALGKVADEYTKRYAEWLASL